MTRWLPVFVALAAIVFCAVDYGYHYKRLPPRVASHFDAQGRADGWSTKGEMVGVALVTLVVVAATLAMMWLLAYHAPPSLINLPNKDYWLAPERQADTRQSLAQWSIWFTAATLWLLALVFHETIVANLRQPPQLKSIWLLMGLYLGIVVLLVIRLFTRFRRPEQSRAQLL